MMIGSGVLKHVKFTYMIFSGYLMTDEKEVLDDQMRGFQTREVHVLAEDG